MEEKKDTKQDRMYSEPDATELKRRDGRTYGPTDLLTPLTDTPFIEMRSFMCLIRLQCLKGIDFNTIYEKIKEKLVFFLMPQTVC